MTEKFTPGPWEVERLYERAPLQVAPRKSVYVVCTFSHNRIDSMPREMREANAALISAAPDMFDALNTLNQLWAENEHGGVDFSHAMNICRKALKKAQGEK